MFGRDHRLERVALKRELADFYQWRGARGERRSLRIAPGHRFDAGEETLLKELITLIMQNAWDAEVLCARDGRADGLRGRISHNEWYEILGP